MCNVNSCGTSNPTRCRQVFLGGHPHTHTCTTSLPLPSPPLSRLPPSLPLPDCMQTHVHVCVLHSSSKAMRTTQLKMQIAYFFLLSKDSWSVPMGPHDEAYTLASCLESVKCSYKRLFAARCQPRQTFSSQVQLSIIPARNEERVISTAPPSEPSMLHVRPSTCNDTAANGTGQYTMQKFCRGENQQLPTESHNSTLNSRVTLH